ncbi:hypothetical protein SAMN05660209_03593 [Geodermatophilus africanus]|uniref:Uncharacterized protein n=1 Tax=Geodermatophilus africanus TaxID=1137993 RepID=A0A1H3M982_9ACTN|nr:hypothetical protein SAMN05660209_03593 [Geodermatophilus africanus]
MASIGFGVVELQKAGAWKRISSYLRSLTTAPPSQGPEP